MSTIKGQSVRGGQGDTNLLKTGLSARKGRVVKSRKGEIGFNSRFLLRTGKMGKKGNWKKDGKNSRGICLEMEDTGGVGQGQKTKGDFFRLKNGDKKKGAWNPLKLAKSSRGGRGKAEMRTSCATKLHGLGPTQGVRGEGKPRGRRPEF